MSKKLMAIVALIACLLMAFAACGTTTGEKLSADGSATTVSSNGGFLAETGDYVYFINGSEVYTEDNTAGKVEKGALVRVKKADLSKGAEATKEVVVSKLLSTGDYSAGIFISGGKVFFATPSADTNKKGEVQNTDVEFCYANLDGTGYTEFATATGTTGNTTVYRFTEVSGKVYVTFITTETVTEDETEVTKNYINIVAEDKSVNFKDEYETYVLDKGNGDYVYYTKTVKNEELDITESFNEVYRVKIGATTAEKIYYGAGSNRNEQDGKQYNVAKGSAGVKFTLVAAQNGYLYFSVAGVDTSTGAVTFYAYVGETVNADPEVNFANLVDETNGTVMTYSGNATVFAATSIYESPECIVYLDSTNGICKYNYKFDGNYEDRYGVTVEYYSKDVITGTIAYVQNGYLYYHVSGVYYKLPYEAGDVADGAKEVKLSPVAFSTAWYAPEAVTVGEEEYLIGTLSSADYHDYVFAVKVEAEADYEALALETDGVKTFIESCFTDEDEREDVIDGYEETTYAEFLTGASRASVLYTWQNAISKLGEAAQEEVDDYIDTTYPLADADSDTAEDEGCSSAMGVTATIGGILVAVAGAYVCKKRG